MEIKKQIIKPIVICFFALAIMLFASGCGKTETQVENLMKVSDNFVGERVVTLIFDKSTSNKADKQEVIENTIRENCPKNLSYRTETTDGTYKCVFVLSFSSLEEYKTKIASIIGKQIAVAYGYTNTPLSKGTYYKEDFDGMLLIAWLDDALYQNEDSKIQLKCESTSNVVKYNSEVFSSKSSTLNTSTVKGEPIKSVTIDTVNHKNTLFDRTMTLSVPITTYNKLGASLQQLMTSRVAPEGVAGWKQNNEYMDFTVKYQKIDIGRLQEYTKLFVDCRNESIYYGDQNKSSTPLAEQLVFEEKIDLLGLVSENAEPVQLTYSYTLPKETTHGEGVELTNGEWATSGSWSNNTYKVSDKNGVYDIRVPDGMQYSIKGIDINLTSNSNNSFKRSVDFIYDYNTGQKGLDYAYNFLASRGFVVSKETLSDGIACRVTQQGTAEELNLAVADLFGSGNSFSSTKHTSDLSVVTSIDVNDNVNIAHMLSGANSNIKINYTAKSDGKEYIRGLNLLNNTSGSTAKAKKAENESYTATVDGGNFAMSYSATVPHSNGIILYCAICSSIILISTLTIVLLIKYNAKLNALEEEQKNNEIKKKPLLKKEKPQKENKKIDINDDDYIKKHYGF